MSEQIEFSDFAKIDVRAGTIISAEVNQKAKKPAYSLEIDFGEDIGIKKSSAQITKEHSLEEIIGSQIIAVTNFPPKNIAGILSEVLVLAIVEKGGRTVLLKPSKPVLNGSPML